MKANRKIAVVVGVLFIFATAFSLMSSAVLGPVLGAAHYLAAASTNANQVILGALLELAAAISVTLIPAAMFPILKQHHEGMALGYFGFRIIEAITQIIGAMSALLLLSLSQAYASAGHADASSYHTLGTLLQATRNWAFPLDPIVFGPGALLLYAVLYQSRLIPRWLSAWGLIGAALVFVLGVVGMFGNILTALAIPIAVQEMVMAVWLIVKGFNPAANSSRPAKADRALSPTVTASTSAVGERQGQLQNA